MARTRKTRRKNTFKGKVEPDRFMEPEEFGKLVEVAEADTDALRAFMLMGMGGLRTVEVTTLKIRDVDRARSAIWVRTAKQRKDCPSCGEKKLRISEDCGKCDGRGKVLRRGGGNEPCPGCTPKRAAAQDRCRTCKAKGKVKDDSVRRYVSLDERTFGLVEGALDGGPEASLVRRDGEPMTKRQIRHLFHSFKRRAGIRQCLGPHSLRHCHGIMLTELGYSPQEIAARLGHKNLEMVLVYSALRRSRNEEMAKGLSGMVFGGKAGPRVTNT